ncbi:MAG: hypothetical protein PUA75_08970 [Clostridiales bacterium]|nr:hypothetical protein [Clostridiales bacterium]
MRIVKKIGYGIVGVLLAASVALTGTYGLSKVDREVYDTAMELEEQMQKKGFLAFTPSKMKVRFFNGKEDYVVRGNVVTKEEAAFDTFVGTTSKIDGDYQVILPAYENFSDMFALLDTAQNAAEGEANFAEDTYSINAHVATLWHEAFHAWQMTNWEKEVNEKCKEAGLGSEETIDEIVLSEVDSDKELVVLFSEEMELLMNAYETENQEEKKHLVTEALAISDKREAQAGRKVTYAENYLEMTEGSARYVEAEVYRLLEGEMAWQKAYLGAFIYRNGTEKYYTMGMYKCLLLDELMPEWKEYYCVTDSLDDYLRNAVKE